MSFDEMLDQIRELLRQRGRLSYRALKLRFELDDAYVEDLKGELIWFTEGFVYKGFARVESAAR